jgi:predicted metal-dependent peptidase
MKSNPFSKSNRAICVNLGASTGSMPTRMLHALAKGSIKEQKESRLSDGPIPKDLAQRVSMKITKARVKMLFQQPFFGTLVTRLQIFAADKWLPTMAVDGKYLYFNHEFVDMLEMDELVFVFAHEILHMVYDHIGRTKSYGMDHKLANIAQDYVVNDELIQVNVGKFPVTVPGLHDLKYRGWNSEKVYEDLLKKQKNNPNASKTLEEMLDKMLDEHLDGNSGEGEGDGQGDEEVNGKGKGKPSTNGPAKLSEDERKQLKAELKQNILNSAQLQGIGNLPAGVQRLVNELIAPKMDWRELLQAQLNSIVPADYSFLRVNRKGWDLDAILPGMTEMPMLKIACALDMSGSITQEMVNEFLSEVKGIMDQYPMYEIRVFCFDTKCYADRTFSSDNGEDIRTYVPKGGGGTDGAAIFNYMKEEDFVPERLVVFTDGYVGDFGDENYCPTVWIIKGSTVVPPFGTFAYFDDVSIDDE